MTDTLELADRVEAQSGKKRKKGPAVIVGPHGHCLAAEHVGGVVATIYGHALRAIGETQ